MSVHGNGKDNREWVVKDRGTGTVLSSGFNSYADAMKELRAIAKIAVSATYGKGGLAARDFAEDMTVVTA